MRRCVRNETFVPTQLHQTLACMSNSSASVSAVNNLGVRSAVTTSATRPKVFVPLLILPTRQKALTVLATVPIAEQNAEYRFLLAVALAFRTGAAVDSGLAPCPHLRPLDELGAGNGPFAAIAAYFAADMRAVSQVNLVSGCFEHGGICEDRFGWLPKRRDAWQRLPEPAKQVLVRRRERERVPVAEWGEDQCSK